MHGLVKEIYPPTIVDLARRRTKDLLWHSITYPMSLKNLVESAYLQGMYDMAEAMVVEGKVVETTT